MANGRLSSSELSPIPGGQLRNDAARAWNDMREEIGRKHGVWIRPLGPQSSYRSYAGQVYFWNLYISGRGNLAARPGTSNHGWGLAVDVASPVMVAYIKRYGPKYGWKKVEAFNEWWHYNYVGGYNPRPKPKRRTTVSRTTPYAADERKWANKLLMHRRGYRSEAKSGKGRRYYAHYGWAKWYRSKLERRVKKINKLAHTKGQGGWARYHRGVRYQAIHKVLKATSGYLPPAK